MQEYIPLALLIANLVAFALYGIDKYKAIRRKRRVPESVLLLFGVPFAALGSLLGMLVFRHKTRKIKFYICLLPMLALQVYMLCCICVL